MTEGLVGSRMPRAENGLLHGVRCDSPSKGASLVAYERGHIEACNP